jgi:hypothetical protein
MTEKQYENLMFAISMLLAAFIDDRPVLPSGRPVDGVAFLKGLYTDEAKEIYDFLMANSFEGDYEALKKKIQEEKLKKLRKKMEEEAKRKAENSDALAEGIKARNSGAENGTAVF